MERIISDQKFTNGMGSWRAISNIWSISKPVEHICRGGIKIHIGNGGRTLMWEDSWLDSGRLMEKFPILYAISLQKHAKVEEYGIWDGLTWTWNLLWRRDMFEWEKTFTDGASGNVITCAAK